MTDEFEVGMIGNLLSEFQFDLNEAINLLHHEVVRIEDEAYLPKPPTEKVGIICGVITLNEEIEILIKYPEGVIQLNRAEFLTQCLQVE